MYRLLQDIFEFKAGYLIQIDGTVGFLGKLPWGWEIPIFIMDAHPDWFEKVTK